ncbi:MAG: hypothetical protein V4710_04635 [Verrucomicrobiota bacterium]
MKTTEKKNELLGQQVNSKVLWGARDREVLDWLQERHGITGTAATGLLAVAHRAKRAAVRKKALLYLIFSIPGMLLALVFVILQVMGQFVILEHGSLLIIGLGFVSAGIFIRSVFRLLTGKTPGSVD